MSDIDLGVKFYIYQFIAVGIIWTGMTFFIDDITGDGKIIYYVVTSWLLFIIVLGIKKFISDRKQKDEE